MNNIENSFSFVIQSIGMNSLQENPLEQLQHIKSMMEKSSRFVSLSGWSGISAGLCALVGAYLAYGKIKNISTRNEYDNSLSNRDELFIELTIIAVGVFLAAFILSFLFTYLQSKKQQRPIWDATSRRLLINTFLPILVGGIFILKLIEAGNIELVASACLIFYGLGLINGSKYTLGEVRYLGYSQIILGVISLFFLYHGLLFWSLGFGVMHIIYGIAMWRKYGY
jgi:hypothetical protein